MKYTALGKSGLQVSKICLGCMTYGDPNRGNHAWTLHESESLPFIYKAFESGINFFDTANVYSDGSSEEILGKAINEIGKRDEMVIATKVNGRMRSDVNGAGLSRKAILAEIENSLRRLQLDYVDLYQIHRWDNQTPIEETMEALHDVVKSGKARYIGASSMYAWQFSKSHYVAKMNGWTPFLTMQNHYNLLYREEEREMMPLCRELGVGVIPWSPLARGRLTRNWDDQTERSQTDEFGKTLYKQAIDADKKIVQSVSTIAEKRKVSRAQVALAWLLSKDFVTSPIIGASKMNHIDDAIAALDLKLSNEEIQKLEEHYIPHRIAGFA